MQMNSKTLYFIRDKLKALIMNEEIIDIILFGSVVKGKTTPKDIDIALILYKEPTEKLRQKINQFKEFHISVIPAKEFFVNPPTIVNTLLREGYSLKNKKALAENFAFLNRVLFKYDLAHLSESLKVKIVNILRGKKGEKGLVETNKGEWLANQVFFVPVVSDKLFEEFFNHFKIKFKKFYVLIH